MFSTDGQAIPVFTYKAVEQEEYIEANPVYLKTVADGLRSLGLPTKCLFAATTNKPPPSMLTTFFCYGTLRKGQRGRDAAGQVPVFGCLEHKGKVYR